MQVQKQLLIVLYKFVHVWLALPSHDQHSVGDPPSPHEADIKREHVKLADVEGLKGAGQEVLPPIRWRMQELQIDAAIVALPSANAMGGDQSKMVARAQVQCMMSSGTFMAKNANIMQSHSYLYTDACVRMTTSDCNLFIIYVKCKLLALAHMHGVSSLIQWRHNPMSCCC